MKPTECYHALLAQKVIEQLRKRNIDGVYYETREEALQSVLAMIPKESVVSCGGSATLHEIGMQEALKKEGYHFLDPDDAQGGLAKDKLAHEALGADYFLMSSNAVTESGELVNIDGYGNRVASLIFGPKHVILIVGINKIVPTLDAAVLRAKTQAARTILLKFKQDYADLDALSKAAEGACSHVVVTSFSTMKGRIRVVLVGENLGY